MPSARSCPRGARTCTRSAASEEKLTQPPWKFALDGQARLGYDINVYKDMEAMDLLKITEAEKKALKGRGLILTNDGEHFIARIVAPNGVFTNEQMQMVTDVARKYGDGRVALTVRLTIEVQGIPYENLEPLVAEVEAAGLVTGGTGSIVRPVVACKGTVCVHGLFDTQAFAKRIYDEFFVGWHNVTLPHKFKIAVGGCPNNCVKPGLNDFGVYGQSVPEQDLDKCRSCVKCGVIERCPVHCVSRGPAGKIVVDKEMCTNCGKCIKACPMHSFSEKERGYAVVIGGIWGKTQRLGNNIGGVYSEDEVMKLIEKAILLYRELGKTGERFGRTIERVGVDEFIRQLKSDDVLSRKDEILAVAAKAKGGASC